MKPVTEPVQVFNRWLLSLRRQSTAAQTVQRLCRRYLHRCHYFHLRGHMTKATIKLQRVSRGHKARKTFRWMRDVHVRGVRSAVAIQRVYRGVLGRRRAEQARRHAEYRHRCAILIQSLARGFIAIQRYYRMQQRLARVCRHWRVCVDRILRKAQRQLAWRSTLKIQQCWRKLLATRLHRAATMIQRNFRGHRARVHLFTESCARLYRQAHAASVMARGYRRHLARKAWKARLWKIKVYEDAYRMEQQRRQVAAAMIERAYCSMVKHRAWCKRKPRKGWVTCAATSIQRVMRGFLAKCRMREVRMERRLHHDKVLAKWKVLLNRMYNRKAVIIQRNWRLARRRRWSARIIQKTYRGHRARVRVARIKAAIRMHVFLTLTKTLWSVNPSS